MYLQAAVVVDEAQLAKPVHKEADSRTGGANHLGQGPLAHLQDGGMGLGPSSKSRQQQESSRQSLLARIEKLIDEVVFNSNNARNQVRDKQPCERGVGRCALESGEDSSRQTLVAREGGAYQNPQIRGACSPAPRCCGMPQGMA